MTGAGKGSDLQQAGRGSLILLLALGLGWAVLVIGPRVAVPFVNALIGPERAGMQPALTETLFSIVVYVPLLAIGLIGGAIVRRNAAALGQRPGSAALVGLAIGIAGLLIAVGYAGMSGTLTVGSQTSGRLPLLLWGAVVIAAQVVAEEVYVRGWLQPALARRWGAWPAVVASAAAFTVLHVPGGVRAPVSLLNLFGGGLLFGLFAARSGGLAGAIASHWAWNASEQLLLGLDPNPGVGNFGALFDNDLAGRAIWGGSPDGLNGSIGMTVALLAILLPLALLARRQVAASPQSLPDFDRFGRAPS